MSEQGAPVRELNQHADELAALVRKAGASVVGVQLEQTLRQVRDFAENESTRIAESLTVLEAPGMTLTSEERERLDRQRAASAHVARKLLEQLDAKPQDIRNGNIWRD